MGVDANVLVRVRSRSARLAQEAAGKPTFDDAKQTLGDRAELLALRTWDERMLDDKKAVKAWLTMPT